VRKKNTAWVLSCALCFMATTGAAKSTADKDRFFEKDNRQIMRRVASFPVTGPTPQKSLRAPQVPIVRIPKPLSRPEVPLVHPDFVGVRAPTPQNR
jgi:hypothetical protein